MTNDRMGNSSFSKEDRLQTMSRYIYIADQHQQETFGPIEEDPSGLKRNALGAKLDKGKNRVGLVVFGFSRALQEVSRVGTYGAQKYTDNGWVHVKNGEERYTDAMLRHILKEACGEQKDPETDIYHAAHAAWNALARLDLMIRRLEG